MEFTSSELQNQNAVHDAIPGWYIPENVKRALIYAATFIFITAVVSYFFSSGFTSGTPSTAGRCLFAAIFLLIGIAHLFYFPQWLSHLYKAGSIKSLVCTFILAVLVTDCILLVFFINGTQSNGLAVTGGAAVMLPYMVRQCMIYYQGIEPKEYKSWVIPAGIQPDTRKSLLLNSVFFRIKMKVKYFDIADTVFSVNLPLRLSLCTVFCRFLYYQHNNIEITDEKQQSYGWCFSVKRWYGKRQLNPENTLKNNGIKQGDTILIERIKLL